MADRKKYIKASMDFYDTLDQVLYWQSLLYEYIRFGFFEETNRSIIKLSFSVSYLGAEVLTQYQYTLGKLAECANILDEEQSKWCKCDTIIKHTHLCPYQLPYSKKVEKRRKSILNKLKSKPVEELMYDEFLNINIENLEGLSTYTM